MSGLLMKDFYNLKNQLRILTIMVVFYIIFALTTKNVYMLNGVVAIMAFMLPITAMAYDERSNWNMYALSMTLSRKTIVMEKYALGLIMSVIAFALNTIFNVFLLSEALIESMKLAAIMFGIGVTYISILMPIMYKYGVEKGRTLMMILLFIPTGLIAVMGKLKPIAISKETIDLMINLSPLFVVGILIASIYTSVKIFTRKDL